MVVLGSSSGDVCVAACCSVLQRVASCCIMLQRVAVRVAKGESGLQGACGCVCCSVLQRVATCCSVLCIVLYYSVM